AEHVGHGSAHRLEWLLGGAKWDADALRDRVREYVVASLGAEDAVLIADDTQVIKKGDKSVGVARQHCGATGQTENCQVMPMLSYASGRGHAFLDRALYLPRRWTDDPQRCAQAGVPAGRGPPGCRSGTSPPTPATAATPGCAPAATPPRCPTCWPSRSICRWSSLPVAPPAPTMCWPPCRKRCGSAAPAARAPRASATTTGRRSRSPSKT